MAYTALDDMEIIPVVGAAVPPPAAVRAYSVLACRCAPGRIQAHFAMAHGRGPGPAGDSHQ